jgi:predicted dehydrogenase
MQPITRRAFLGGTLAAGATALLPSSRVLGANDDIRVAVIGFNGRGKSHISDLLKLKGARLVALCDVDPAVLASGVQMAEKGGAKVETYTDVRKLLESKDIDAITTATPNHWHSLIGIWACQAGKDAYVEKPISHDVWEGRQLVNAARKYKRVVQGGTQSRSSERIRTAVNWVRAGNLGKIKAVYGFCYKPRPSIGKVGHGEIPAGLDYNLWTGPAAMEPLRRKNLHYDWHWVYNTGNGDMGNQGIHQMDIARWFLGVNDLSPRVMSIGGRLGYDDDGETPNTQVVFHDYEPAPLIFETRGLPRSREFQAKGMWIESNMDVPNGFPRQTGVGNLVECEGGRICVAGDIIAIYDAKGARMPDLKPEAGGEGHMANFIEAVRAHNPAHLHAECLETHLSSALCHTGLISHRLGKTMPAGEIAEHIRSDRLATERFEAMKEHLARNGVDISSAGSQAALGPMLTFDPQKERFTGHSDGAANAMLRRKGREPFVVPEV